MIAYKVLGADGTGPYSAFRWPLPDGGAGAWVEAAVEPCRSGVHACRLADLPAWLGTELYEIELAGEIADGPMKLVAPRGRLTRRIDGWDGAAREAYVRMCAGRAHALAHSVSPPLDGWEVPADPSKPEGPALIGFVAAAIAEELSGLDGWREERARQAGWLAERLGLTSRA